MATKEEKSRLLVTVLVVMVVATIFAAAGMYINRFSDAPCSLESLLNKKRNATEEESDEKICGTIEWYMKVLLIATHLLAFALFPFAMHVFYVRAPQLQQKGAQNPGASILGFSFLMVSISGEIGWHVGQQWFYQEEYHILNFMFYFFFMAAIPLWAAGIKKKEPEAGEQSILYKILDKADVLVILGPILVTLVYAAAVTFKTFFPGAEFCIFTICLPLTTKIPIYILMLVEFTVLSYRLFKLLDNDLWVLLLPFFSVVVNLIFIFLLGSEQFINDPFYNPLFHTLHDLIGTLLGVFIATELVWSKTSPEDSREKSE